MGCHLLLQWSHTGDLSGRQQTVSTSCFLSPLATTNWVQGWVGQWEWWYLTVIFKMCFPINSIVALTINYYWSIQMYQNINTLVILLMDIWLCFTLRFIYRLILHYDIHNLLTQLQLSPSLHHSLYPFMHHMWWIHFHSYIKRHMDLFEGGIWIPLSTITR